MGVILSCEMLPLFYIWKSLYSQLNRLSIRLKWHTMFQTEHQNRGQNHIFLDPSSSCSIFSMVISGLISWMSYANLVILWFSRKVMMGLVREVVPCHASKRYRKCHQWNNALEYLIDVVICTFYR